MNRGVSDLILLLVVITTRGCTLNPGLGYPVYFGQLYHPSISIRTMEASNLQPGQNLAHLLPPSWKADIQRWFAEDTPSFDWAGFVVGEEEQEAILWGKSGVGPLPMMVGRADK
jgi:hypothetical protein